MSSNNNSHRQSQDFDDENPRLRNLATGPASEFMAPFENDAFAQSHGQGAFSRACNQQPQPMFRSPYEAPPRNQQAQAPDWRMPGNLGAFGGFGAQPDMSQYQPYGGQPGMRQYQQDQPAFGSPYENAAHGQESQLRPQPNNAVYNPYMTGNNSGSGTFNNNVSYNAPQSNSQNWQAFPGGQTILNAPSAYGPKLFGQQGHATALQQQSNAQPAAPTVHPANMYKTFEEAVADISPPSWNCLQNDNTIPVTEADSQQWVLRLKAAVNNTTNVHDDTDSASFKKRWHDPITGPSTYYPEMDRELLCWQIHILAEDMHRIGPSVLLSFDPTFWENAEKTKTWTFQERMNEIIDLLTHYKSRVDTLMGGGSIQTVVAHPRDLLILAQGDKKANNKRQAQLKAVGEAKKAKTSPAGR
jgi:hypothetical protein